MNGPLPPAAPEPAGRDSLEDPHLCADHLRAAIHAARAYQADAINVHQDLLAACVAHLDRLAGLEAGVVVEVESRELWRRNRL